MATDNFDVNSLLDGTLDDLADLPEFRAFPAGTHIVTLTIVDKTAPKNRINNHPGFEFKLKLVETKELADSSAEPLEPGAETGVLFLLDNPIGQGLFKKMMAAAAESFGAKPIRELVNDLNGATVAVVTKQRQNKDKTQTYTDIVELMVV